MILFVQANEDSRMLELLISVQDTTCEYEVVDLDDKYDLSKYSVILTVGEKATEKHVDFKKFEVAVNQQYDKTPWVVPIHSWEDLKDSDKRIHAAERVQMAILHDVGDQALSANQLVPYTIVKSMEEFRRLVDYVKETKTFCFDFETTGTEWHRSYVYPTMLSVSFQVGHSYVIPMYHKGNKWLSADDIEDVFQCLNDEVFKNESIEKIAHNLKFDMHIARAQGISGIDGICYDTMLMAHLLDEDSPKSLKYLTSVYFPELAGYEDEIVSIGYDKIDFESLAAYAAVDTDSTLKLKIHMTHRLLYDEESPSKDSKQYVAFRNLIMPAFWALFDAEHKGAKIDRELLERSIAKFEVVLKRKYDELLDTPTVRKFMLIEQRKAKEIAIASLEEKIANCKPLKNGGKPKKQERYEAQLSDVKAGVVIPYEGLNLNSTTQLGDLLYEAHGYGFDIPIIDDAPKRTTAKGVIQEFRDPEGFIDKLFVYRSISVALSTYLKGILQRLDENDRLHTSFLIHGTKTGRISSRNPNFQNIPNRLKFDDSDYVEIIKTIKRLFIPPDSDQYIMTGDYSQAELRIIANFAKEPAMINAYLNGIDIHSLTGSNINDLTLDQFMDKKENDFDFFYLKRTEAKGANFSMVYGCHFLTYQDYLRRNYKTIIDDDTAERHHQAFFRTYSALPRWHETYKAKARKFGYVRTLFGTKRRLKNIHSRNMKKRLQDERFAINTPIQGTGGQYALLSMALMRHRFLGMCQLFNTIHDSVFYYMPKKGIELFIDIFKKSTMYPPIELLFGVSEEDVPVPMKVDVEISDNSWVDMDDYENFMQKDF